MLHTTMRRWAAAGAVTALAAAGLVATTTATATATPASATYTCTTSIGDQDVDINFDADALTLPTVAGKPVDGGSAVIVEATVSPTLAAILDGLAADGLTSSDMALKFGSAAVPVNNLHVTNVTPHGDGSRTYSAAGKTGKFTAPAAGDTKLKTPKKFNLDVLSGGETVASVPCVTSAPAVLGSSTLKKQASTTNASLADAKITKGAKAKVTAKVTQKFGTSTGKVKVFKGQKVIGAGKLKKGKATITTDPFKKTGTFKLTVKYLGSGYAKPSSDQVTLKVVK
jgi:hypothetical protein